MLTQRIPAVVLCSLLLICCASHLPAQQANAPRSASKSPSITTAPAFTTETAAALLDRLLQSLQAHNETQFLSAFDSEFMANYGSFSDQVDAFFTQYENFDGRFRILDVGGTPEQPLALVQFDLEAQPVTFGAAWRKSSQVRFEFIRGKKNWKVVNLTPRTFFSS